VKEEQRFFVLRLLGALNYVVRLAVCEEQINQAVIVIKEFQAAPVLLEGNWLRDIDESVLVKGTVRSEAVPLFVEPSLQNHVPA
jgi:hypothetical protein